MVAILALTCFLLRKTFYIIEDMLFTTSNLLLRVHAIAKRTHLCYARFVTHAIAKRTHLCYARFVWLPFGMAWLTNQRYAFYMPNMPNMPKGHVRHVTPCHPLPYKSKMRTLRLGMGRHGVAIPCLTNRRCVRFA